MSTLYLTLLRDTETWGACIRAHDKLIEAIKIRDEACSQFTKKK